MARALRTAAIIGALVLCTGGVAIGAEPGEAGMLAAERGYYVEPGSTVDPSTVASVAADSSRRGLRLIPVALATAPDAGATVFADAVLDRIGSGTVIVYAPGEIGYSSTEVSRASLDAAASRSLPAFRSDPSRGFAAFGEALLSGAGSGTSTGSRPGFGFGLLPLLLLLAPLLFFFMFRRGMTRQVAYAQEEDVAGAEEEVRRQLSVLANSVVELSDIVALSDSPEAKSHFRDASETYSTVEDLMQRPQSYGQLEAIADRLDHARWQIEATRAILDGKAPPPEPAGEPSSCFFDPAHGAGVVRADVQGPQGSAPVHICRACAAALERGEQPEPAWVHVGEQDMPVAMAPRAFGGFGFGMLGPFSLLLPGLGAVLFNWGGGGGFGGGMLGGGMLGGGMFGGRSRGGMGMGRSRGGMSFGRSRGGRRL